MIVNDFDIFGSDLSPSKAYAKLVVDSDAVLAFPISFQCFKPVSRWHPKILKMPGDLELPQLSAGCWFDIHESPDPLTASQLSRIGALEG